MHAQRGQRAGIDVAFLDQLQEQADGVAGALTEPLSGADRPRAAC